MRQYVVAFTSGLVFAIGLLIGGMTDPAKVLAFLDFTGAWDPSLLFVMGGAVLVYAPLYRIVTRTQRPWLAAFQLPSRGDIDVPLVGGAVLFGLGWGLSGFCPGPALVSVVGLGSNALLVAGSMLVGMAGFAAAKRALASRRKTP